LLAAAASFLPKCSAVLADFAYRLVVKLLHPNNLGIDGSSWGTAPFSLMVHVIFAT